MPPYAWQSWKLPRSPSGLPSHLWRSAPLAFSASPLGTNPADVLTIATAESQKPKVQRFFVTLDFQLLTVVMVGRGGFEPPKA
jgi:hypothetical protein